MNFASKLSKEIKKSKRDGKRRKVENKNGGGVSRPIVDSEDKEMVHKSDKGNSEAPVGPVSAVDGSKAGVRSDKNPEPKKAAKISDEELRHRLKQFQHEYDPTKRGDELKKLHGLIKHQKKQERYKIQQDKEANTDSHIELDSITNPQSYDKLNVQIRIYIKQLVLEWDKLPESIDKSLVRETKLDLVMLLYLLRTNGLTKSMVVSLATICYYLQQNNYRKANESYMKLSIGNVAWPIGVMNVGIHERSKSNRTMKSSSSEETFDANIMIDDKTRKWIVAIKRLITVREKMETI